MGSLVEPLEPRVPDAPEAPPQAATGRGRRLWVATVRLRWPILIYLGTRVLLLAVAIVYGALRHHNLTHELANWDGLWYRRLADHGYPTHVSHVQGSPGQSTLGFFPLYPLLAWVGGHALMLLTTQPQIWSVTVAGVLISFAGGLAMSILVYLLAVSWWGVPVARRAVLLFWLFPGSIVFSMVYAEGIMLPLAAGCILALQRRRWVTAGVLAGIATATEPEALILVLVCAISSLLELRRRGWRLREARRSLVAPLLSLSGAVAVASFFWAWTGTPFANLIAQHYGWQERTDPFALVHLVSNLAGTISLSHFNHPTINLNLVVGVVGTIVLVVLLVLVYYSRRELSVEAIVWTIGISFLMVTSEFTPPNPRLLMTAFPAVLVVGRYVKGRAYACLACATGLLLVVLSALTFIGTTLRP